MLARQLEYASVWKISSLHVCLKRFYWHRMGYKPKNIEPGSFPFPRKQVPVEGRKSYLDRTQDLFQSSNKTSWLHAVNIGFAVDPPKRVRDALKNPELEPLARRRELKLSVETIHAPENDKEAPFRRKLAAEHYGIFDDLFMPNHYFCPVVDVPLYYSQPSSEYVNPVFCGNYISPNIAQMEPLVDLSRLPKNRLWTLIMTCPDEPLSDVDASCPAEYIHWMVSNIDPEMGPDSIPKGGQLIVEYLPPLPYSGTGFHRYVFTLYCQDGGPIDLSCERRGPVRRDHHKERAFSTAEFYRNHQDQLTPVGLAFFQSSWDNIVRTYFRNNLPELREPIFEVEFPQELPPPQSRFPLANSWFHSRRHPRGLPLADSRLGVFEDVSFDVYLDRYRDRKEMNTELVRQRLAEEGNPLESSQQDPHERSPFPLASPPLPSNREVPSWWRHQEITRRLRRGRWAQLDGHDG